MAINYPSSLDEFVNPTSSNRLDDGPVLHNVQHSNANDAIRELQKKVGVNFSSVETSLDYIINLILTLGESHPKAGYKEVTGGFLPQYITWYVDSSKEIILIRKEYSYEGDIPILPTSITVRLFSGMQDNDVIRTIVDEITYDRIFEVSRTRFIL